MDAATALDLLLARACRSDWHTYVKPPFGGAEHVLAYVAVYTHRIAISNRRILAFDGENVTFAWRDYADENRQKELTLPAIEFLRRFAMHIVPPRFTRVRYQCRVVPEKGSDSRAPAGWMQAAATQPMLGHRRRAAAQQAARRRREAPRFQA